VARASLRFAEPAPGGRALQFVSLAAVIALAVEVIGASWAEDVKDLRRTVGVAARDLLVRGPCCNTAKHDACL
jgi:hypothetical protein